MGRIEGQRIQKNMGSNPVGHSGRLGGKPPARAPKDSFVRVQKEGPFGFKLADRNGPIYERVLNWKFEPEVVYRPGTHPFLDPKWRSAQERDLWQFVISKARPGGVKITDTTTPESGARTGGYRYVVRLEGDELEYRVDEKGRVTSHQVGERPGPPQTGGPTSFPGLESPPGRTPVTSRSPAAEAHPAMVGGGGAGSAPGDDAGRAPTWLHGMQITPSTAPQPAPSGPSPAPAPAPGGGAAPAPPAPDGLPEDEDTSAEEREENGGGMTPASESEGTGGTEEPRGSSGPGEPEDEDTSWEEREEDDGASATVRSLDGGEPRDRPDEVRLWSVTAAIADSQAFEESVPARLGGFIDPIGRDRSAGGVVVGSTEADGGSTAGDHEDGMVDPSSGLVGPDERPDPPADDAVLVPQGFHVIDPLPTGRGGAATVPVGLLLAVVQGRV